MLCACLEIFGDLSAQGDRDSHKGKLSKITIQDGNGSEDLFLNK